MTGEADAADATTAAPPAGLDAAIERWFADHFHGSPHLRDTDAFNHLRRAVDDLKLRLAGAE